MANFRHRRRQCKKSQPHQPEMERESSPRTVDKDSRLLTRAGRARIRYCFNLIKRRNSLEKTTLAALLGTSVSAVDKVLSNWYNRTVDNIKQDDSYISPRFKNWFTLMCQNTQYLSSEPETKKGCKNVGTEQGSVKPTSEMTDVADSISQAECNKRLRKRKIESQTDNDDAQSAAPVSKRSRQDDDSGSQSIVMVEPTGHAQIVTKPSKKLRKFFKRLGYRDETAVLSRLVQCGTTESFLLTMHGLLGHVIASRLQTLNSLMETERRFMPAELELLAYKIASATDSDWSLLSDGE